MISGCMLRREPLTGPSQLSTGPRYMTCCEATRVFRIIRLPILEKPLQPQKVLFVQMIAEPGSHKTRRQGPKCGDWLGDEGRDVYQRREQPHCHKQDQGM